MPEPLRHCIRCSAEITACMGFQLARDTLAAWDGLIPWSQVREHCGRCALVVDEDYLRSLPAPGGSGQIPVEEEPNVSR